MEIRIGFHQNASFSPNLLTTPAAPKYKHTNMQNGHYPHAISTCEAQIPYPKGISWYKHKHKKKTKPKQNPIKKWVGCLKEKTGTLPTSRSNLLSITWTVWNSSFPVCLFRTSSVMVLTLSPRTVIFSWYMLLPGRNATLNEDRLLLLPNGVAETTVC